MKVNMEKEYTRSWIFLIILYAQKVKNMATKQYFEDVPYTVEADVIFIKSKHLCEGRK